MALDLGKFIIRFVDEARNHLCQIEQGLHRLEITSTDAEVINAIFRSAHTIKGSSGMLKLDSIAETAHKLEDVLAAMRDKTLFWSAELGFLLQRTVDVLALAVENLANGQAAGPCDAELLAALQTFLLRDTESLIFADVETGQGSRQESRQGPVGGRPDTSPVEASPGIGNAALRLKTADTARIPVSRLDELIKLMGEVVSSHARLRQRLVDVRFLGKSAVHASDKSLSVFAQNLQEDILAQSLLMDELYAKALVLRMLPLSIMFEPAARMVRELGRTLGKQVDCVVEGMGIELDRQLIERMSDSVVHVLRNAVDHGIEMPAIRQALGKPQRGRISISAHQDGEWVVIAITDDGAGIPVEALRKKAIQKGLFNARQAALLSEHEVIDLIFAPGFSTATIVTDISGRGVGMDVVKHTLVDELQGMLSVESVEGKGASFIFRLPVSLAIMRVLLIIAEGQRFGFIAQYVSAIVRFGAANVIAVAERRVLKLHNEFIPIVDLAGILALPRAGAGQKNEHLLLVLKVHHEKIALKIDALLDESDRVINPLPEHLRRLPLVCGLISLDANELVSILNGAALLEAARRQHSELKIAPGVSSVLKVLVVDDSFNTREIERDVLEAHGYAVMLAEDGQDALNKALAHDFDAVLTDVEMPQMDGFSLTAALRNEERYRFTPIIIITSRENDSDRRRGIEVGADAYIVKGDFNQHNFLDTLKALIG
jgi:two-component system chemotaxis sensor kinase CheA